MQVVIDFNDAKEKQVILQMVRDLHGPHRVEIVKYRKRHSDRQRRFYFPAVVQLLADHLRGQGASVTDDDIHEMLKWKFLRRTVVDPGTGEVIGEHPGSTRELSVDDFSEYIEKCSAYLLEQFGLEVQSAEVFA